MAKCAVNEFELKKNVLANAKAVIYDQRSFRKLSFFKVIPHLIKKEVISTCWNIPQTVYPDRKEVEFTESNWSIYLQKPFFNSKSIIINVSDIISSQKTMMDIIEHYKLATTVGKRTAGCNRNSNVINLPCGYKVRWTGMKVLKQNGSQLYLKGFQPDYLINENIQAIKEGRDENLEKTLEIARQD